jgi:S-adenosylmethionine:tRNA ribosyltransferase-isomerase
MKTADYDFFLPKELIASRPAEQRDGSRLMVLRRGGGCEHRHFCDLPSLLDPGDLLVVNNSKVFPARLRGVKPSGCILEILLVRRTSPGVWEIMSKGRYSGPLTMRGGLSAVISEGNSADFGSDEGLMETVWRVGEMPLPHYIGRQADDLDKERYQTVYAEVEGSIAAPTAGLHFTDKVLAALASKSVKIRSLTLHVGTGTFRPVKSEFLSGHVMDSEVFEMDTGLIRDVEEAKKRGNRVVAVGTTATRALEGYFSGRCSLSSSNGSIRGLTDIFIHEGYTPKTVSALITNFHLPCSTPLMLTSVFAGRTRLLDAYGSAMAMGYRFFSYGDAMLVI